MKNTLLTFAAILFAAISMNAQDLYLSWEGVTLSETITVWGEPTANEIIFNAVVHNNTDNGMNIKVRRNQVEIVDGTLNQFFWGGVLYPYEYDESTKYQLILPDGQSEDDQFYARYRPDSKIGTSTVEYIFFNKDNENQNVKITVKYRASPEGIAEDAMKGGSISDVYPNPATNVVNIDYEFTPEVDFAKVKIVNLLGAVVKEAIVERDNNKLTIDISELEGGIYFYSVLVNGDIYKTKKLIVQK